MRQSWRWYTVKVVVITSLFWILVQSISLFYQTTCHDSGDSGQSNKFQPIQGQEQPKTGGLFQRLINGLVANNMPEHPGDMGKAVEIPEALKAESKETFKLNQFNLVASDLVWMNRTLPDYRLEGCKTQRFPSDLPDTTVVIVFHNEAWSTLLRTVHSVINRSPAALLREIILVDDASERVYLKTPLDRYVASLSKPVKVLRMGARSGLIRARLRGAKHAVGKTITFLDAHCEATQGWLEPLVAEIKRNRKAVVCPIIDVISDDTFEYITGSDLTWGGFNWKLNFRWYPVPQRENERRKNDRSLPMRSPTMAGGLFTIDRNYFYEIGAYDPGMEIWGGENLEMSFRVWMCGGELLIVTCSRVGHVFRKTSPYSWPGGVSNILNKNNMRTVMVWLDDYKDFYLKMNPGARHTAFGDIDTRVALRTKLECKNFKWYLENIYPESLIPSQYYSMGEMKHKASMRCLDTMSRKTGETVALIACHGLGGNQVFVYNYKRAIQADDLCLDISAATGPVKLYSCHGMGGNQLFLYDRQTFALKHERTGMCLAGPTTTEKDMPSLVPCDGSFTQQWELEDMKWKEYTSRT